jgi:hypothetical protein
MSEYVRACVDMNFSYYSFLFDVLFSWLQILASRNANSSKLVTVEHIVQEHWQRFGRNFFTRYAASLK